MILENFIRKQNQFDYFSMNEQKKKLIFELFLWVHMQLSLIGNKNKLVMHFVDWAAINEKKKKKNYLFRLETQKRVRINKNNNYSITVYFTKKRTEMLIKYRKKNYSLLFIVISNFSYWNQSMSFNCKRESEKS